MNIESTIVKFYLSVHMYKFSALNGTTIHTNIYSQRCTNVDESDELVCVHLGSEQIQIFGFDCSGN